MLTSKAWLDRLVKKSSALGIASVLVLPAGSLVGATTAAQAAVLADQTMTINYTCTGGAFAGTTNVQAKITTSDTLATSTTNVPVKLDFISIKPTKELAAQTKVEVEADLTITGGTPTPLAVDQEVTLTTAVAANTNVTVPQDSAPVTVASGSTSVTVAPTTVGSLGLTLRTVVGTTEEESVCNTTSSTPANLITTIGGAGGGGTAKIVDYKCTGPGTNDVQNVQMTVDLTMPTNAKVNTQFNIGWKGTWVAGKELKAPATGTLPDAKIFAYATITGITGLTSATGEGTTGAITAGAIIPLPAAAFDLKTTASTAGSGKVKPGAVNFGSNAGTGTTPKIACEVQNVSALQTYDLTVGTATSTSPTATATTSTPNPTTTRTVVVTKTPVGGGGGVTKTPKAGAETGGGGELGPDGRMFVLTGSVMIAAAGVGGLMMRRRRTLRG